MKRLKSVLAGIAMVTSATVSSAAPWSQTIDFNPDPFVGGAVSSYSWIHDLTGAGFEPLNDLISGFTLTIGIYDDQQDPIMRRGEIAALNIPSLLPIDAIWTSPIGFNSYSGGPLLPLAAMFQLNALGSLSVTLSSLSGDFYLASSQLNASGYDGHHDGKVPEPATLALVGLGLAGMALRQRRRKNLAP